MKKLVLCILTLAITMGVCFAATTQDALNFFNKYVAAANAYNPIITTMYAPDAKIIRQVVKPDGSIISRQTNTARYVSEMKKGQAIAKIRKYKNYYTNVSVQNLGNNKFKISSLRQPSGETYKLKAYMVVQQKPNGQWTIVEEMMQTKVQMLINAK
ncbi:MAG: hypothetical protein ACI4S3_07760 [Candidatus Gastranaerophilaceae bacterium]